MTTIDATDTYTMTIGGVTHTWHSRETCWDQAWRVVERHAAETGERPERVDIYVTYGMCPSYGTTSSSYVYRYNTHSEIEAPRYAMTVR